MQEEVAGGLVKLQVVLAVLGDDSRWYWRDGRSVGVDICFIKGHPSEKRRVT